MNSYKIEHKIRVLLSCDVNIGTSASGKQHSFTTEGITFQPWSNDPREYWKAGEWRVRYTTEAANGDDAIREYAEKMSRVVPRIAFVGQAYINDRTGPIFMSRDDIGVGWFRSVITQEAVPLGFMEEEKEALDALLDNKAIPDVFYNYWNDAVNSTSYTGKLLLMFGAIDSVAARGERRVKRQQIVGKLFDELYENDESLRNRLTHGEYITEDSRKNYVEIIHKKVLEYINKNIIKKDLLELEIVGPQRHFDENYASGRFFIKCEDSKPVPTINELIEDAERNDGIPTSYNIISYGEIEGGF